MRNSTNYSTLLTGTKIKPTDELPFQRDHVLIALIKYQPSIYLYVNLCLFSHFNYKLSSNFTKKHTIIYLCRYKTLFLTVHLFGFVSRNGVGLNSFFA